MKKLVLFAVAALAVGVGFAQPSEARLRLVTRQVNWLNTNRVGCGTVGCVGADTVYAGASTTKNDTTVNIGVGDLVPMPFSTSSTAADSTRMLARFTIVSDSSAAGTVTAFTLTVDGVVQSSAATQSSWASVSPSFKVFSTLVSAASGSRVITVPIFSSPVNNMQGGGVAWGSNQFTPYMAPAWRIALSSYTGTANSLRAYISFYVDE